MFIVNTTRVYTLMFLPFLDNRCRSRNVNGLRLRFMSLVINTTRVTTLNLRFLNEIASHRNFKGFWEGFSLRNEACRSATEPAEF